MIVDTSALLAIAKREPEATRYLELMLAVSSLSISAGTVLEATIMAHRLRRPAFERRLEALFEELGMAVVPFDAQQMEIARHAYRDFGRGSGHPARLNFGDCFAYALAKVRSEPLLFKGDDFSHTDLTPAFR